MAKRKNFRQFREEEDWGGNDRERKRYDKKRQKIRNARKQKRKMKNSFFDDKD